MAVCCENHTEHTNIIFSVKLGVRTYLYIVTPRLRVNLDSFLNNSLREMAFLRLDIERSGRIFTIVRIWPRDFIIGLCSQFTFVLRSKCVMVS